MNRLSLVRLMLVLAAAGLGRSRAVAAPFDAAPVSLEWAQTAAARSFRAFPEREALSALDRSSRIVFAVQAGRQGPALDSLAVAWRVTRAGAPVAEGMAPITNGLLDLVFDVAGLATGRYDVAAALRHGDETLETASTFFRVEAAEPPPAQGSIAIHLPRGVPLKQGHWPVSFGVPFPKGALWDAGQVRLKAADGTVVPIQTTVRSRWGHSADSSIRWLGVDFQAAPAPAWWPERQASGYRLEYGPSVQPAPPAAAVSVRETARGFEVDTGVLRFLVPRDRFVLLDEVALRGRPVWTAAPTDGLYLVDHEGAVYRAANDRAVSLTVEEQGDLRTTIRAEGWFVRDGSDGSRRSYTLPTDTLCKFITRIEAYAGRADVRILHTWVLTFDPFTVRLRDVGLALPFRGADWAEFGVEGGAPLRQRVPAGGVYLIQHLPDAFAVETGAGKSLAVGARSAGWVMAGTGAARLAVGHRDTWQRFPKELEVTPESVRVHLWPAHGRLHPEIDTMAHEQINRLWFAHQGREMNLVQPWGTYFATARIAKNPSSGIYSPAGMPMAGIHSSAMGSSLTSDLLLQFAEPDREAPLRDEAACFQAAPHAVADPRWTCDSLAAGYLHPYDPEAMPEAESAMADTMRAYWEIQDTCGEFGMWLYRPWHHTQLREKGKLELYRLHNATHHYDAYMPWMLYARSGDPFYLTQGMANMRLLPEVQVLHYDDPSYPHREFHFGQGRLVGSTKHTNGFNTWGGDHAILAHLTCYNAMMLAHYLTGDLRLREVVVDEWQKTLIHERLNPEYAKADRTASVSDTTMQMGENGARDVTCALGELMDLYQMTYEPRLLALMAPMMDFFLNAYMRPWGMPVHHALLFYGSEQAKRQLLDGVEAYRRSNGKPQDPKRLWYTHAPFDNFALAAILDPTSGAQVDAWLSVNLPRMTERAAAMKAQSPNCVTFCTIPDWIVYMPRVMAAVARAGGSLSIDRIAAAQAMPAGDATLGGWLRCLVRQDKPEPFAIELIGQVGPDGAPLQVYGPEDQLILETRIPAGSHAPYTLPVPSAGAGVYTIFVQARDGKDNLMVPLTRLPEIYCPGYWSQHRQTRFFTRSAGETPEVLEIQPHATPGSVLTDDMRLLGATEKGEWIKAEVGPEGAWVIMKSRYVHVKGPVPLAIDRARWFAPPPDRLTLKPKPPAKPVAPKQETLAP